MKNMSLAAGILVRINPEDTEFCKLQVASCSEELDE